MKYVGAIEINKSKEEVVKYFEDPQYPKNHQDGFLRKVHISSEKGQKDVVSKMYYKQGKGEMELTETILVNNLPDSFEGFYHHKHMDNTMKTSFIAIDENTTKYVTEVEYVAFRGFMPKMLGLFFKGMFRKQGEKWMVNFKNFVEKQ